MNSANGPDMPAPSTLDDMKKIIQEATPQLVLKGLRNGVIPLFAMVNYNSTPKGRELLLAFLEWQEKVKAYIKEEYPAPKAATKEPEPKEVTIGPVEVDPWSGKPNTSTWTNTSDITYYISWNVAAKPEEVPPDA